MVMDSGIELSGMFDEMRFGDLLSNQNPMNGFKIESLQTYFNQSQHYSPACVPPSNEIPDKTAIASRAPAASASPEDDSLIFTDIHSDITLGYISKMLLEEDIEDKFDMHQGDLALLAAEKPFYEILGEKFLPSPDRRLQQDTYTNNGLGSPDDSHSNNGSCITGIIDNNPVSDSGEPSSAFIRCWTCLNQPSPSSLGSPNGTINFLNGTEEYHPSSVGVDNFFLESQPVWQFEKGVEEASKFLPDANKLVIDLESSEFVCPHHSTEKCTIVEVKAEGEKVHTVSNQSRGRKISYHEDLIDSEEERNVKQSAFFSSENIVRTELLDKLLLCKSKAHKNAVSSLREALKNEASKNAKNEIAKGSNGGKSKGRKNVKKEVVDLRTLLIQCAQSVASDDRRSAKELLKKIREHSSPFGDGSQRLAQVFADGLEARLAGTGSQIYHSLVAKRTSATDILKAYHLYLAACPFKKISLFFANQTILNVAEKATRLHIIDFGIYFGFQWPCLIRRLALREGGPPLLRITGIDVPQPGFRPTERIEETGRRLADYARSFNVPFEYHPIASKWEDIRIADLDIRNDEMLVVNCLYKFRNLADETVVVDSPRNIVLNNIRKMSPSLFIHGAVNGAYSAPFFVTRFREALFHFSSLFDMLEATVPREQQERLLIEREIFGREAMNVIACEGSERVERPETYKQWQVRNLRAGFVQVPLNPDLLKKARDKVKTCYNKNFVIDEDSKWLLQGWKGRIIYALSTWRPSIGGF